MLDNFPLFSFEGNQSKSQYPFIPFQLPVNIFCLISTVWYLFDTASAVNILLEIVSIFLWYNVITVPLFGVLLSMCKYSFVWLRLKLKLKLTERWTQNDGKARERANSNIYFIISGATTNVKANKNLGDFLFLFTNTQFEFKMELQSAI